MTTPAQALVAAFESDLFTVGGAPLVTLLQNLITHKGNFLAQQADWIQFVAAAPGAGIQIGIEFEQQILTAALTKIQAIMAAKGTAPTAAA